MKHASDDKHNMGVFSIFVIYHGQSSAATVRALAKGLVNSFEVMFFDGTLRLFKTYVSNDVKRWSENGEFTQLAVEVGSAIEYHQKYGHLERSPVFKVHDETYIASSFLTVADKNTVFKVYHSDCTFLYPQSFAGSQVLHLEV